MTTKTTTRLSLSTLIAVLAVAIATKSPAQAADLPLLQFRNHHFVPDHIDVPAGQKFTLQVQNLDATDDEFESNDLDREELVPAGKSITVYLGPLDPGTYHFFGDFHQNTAQGVLVAK
jgi:pyruvate kinase